MLSIGKWVLEQMNTANKCHSYSVPSQQPKTLCKLTALVTDAAIRQQGFTCYDDSITVPLTVQAGDILGACVFNPTDGNFFTRRQLVDVVGRVDGESLLRMGAAGCSTTALPTDIKASQLSTVNSRRLHLYANIGTQCGTHTNLRFSVDNFADLVFVCSCRDF
jgi:hypothetical protein